MNEEGFQMIKTMKLAVLSTMIATSLYAGNFDENTQAFIGLEAGYASVDGQRFGIVPEDGSFFHKSSNVEYGLHIGAKSDEWRATFAFNYYDNVDADQNVEKVLGMIDYFFISSPDATIKPYIGANIGVVNYESTLVDVSDFIYGGQAGVVISAGDSIDVDLGYRYSLSGSTKLNDLSSVVFGLNYIY